MKIVVVAGGTGGHFYPGLAAAKTLRLRGHDVRFLVRNADAVLPMLEKETFPFATISAGGFRRRLTLENVAIAARNLKGIFEAGRDLDQDRPDRVLAMGGYLSFPVALAAKWRGIPVVLHEQNAVPGLANRVLRRLASRVAVAFDVAKSSWPDAVVTGNPVRPEFSRPPEAAAARRQWGLAENRLVLLVFGGSLGARAVNHLVVDALALRKDLAARVHVLHFTGKDQGGEISAAYARSGVPAVVSDYCHDMVSAYAAADGVVSRAGASTIAELVALRKPALLIPYPFATNDHQWANAQSLARNGAAESRREKDLTPDTFGAWLETTLFNNDRRLAMVRAFDSVAGDPFQACERIADAVETA